jgi:hypothetical protein
MKAWHVFCGDPHEGSLLIYAKTRNQAKSVAIKKGPYDVDFYTDLSARRSPEHDCDSVNKACCIETNADLPAGGMVPFYNDDEED